MEAEKQPFKILFVCGRNVDRSPTAEAMFKGSEGLDVKSAGVSVGATDPVTKKLVDWADAIFVMEFKHQRAILKIAPKAWKKVESLEIADKYYRDQPELKQLIVEKMKPYMKKQ
jgi:predicted protein tyrosine phosphatase